MLMALDTFALFYRGIVYWLL